MCNKIEDTSRQKVVSANKEYPKCFICGTNIKKKITYDKVCSSECAKLKLEYNTIIIPKPFIRRVAILTHSEKERREKIVAFANRHGYNISLCIKKIKRLTETI